MLTLTTIFLIFILYLVLKMFIIVPMRDVVIVERLGKFHDVFKPGFHLLIPFVDQVAYRHEMREQIIDIPAQTVITRDNIQVEVDGLVYLKVMDAQKASYGIGDYVLAAINLAQTTMRSEVGKLTLGETFSERDSLNETIVKEIDKASDPWGIKVLRYEIRNICPSSHVVHTLEKQMEAERQKRAEITRARAEKEAVINISVGDRTKSINISEGEMIKRMNLAKGKAEAITIIAEATSKGIKMVAESIRKPGGDKAVRMQIMQEFIEELSKILDKSNVSVVPAQLANIKGFFEGVQEVTTGLDSHESKPKTESELELEFKNKRGVQI